MTARLIVLRGIEVENGAFSNEAPVAINPMAILTVEPVNDNSFRLVKLIGSKDEIPVLDTVEEIALLVNYPEGRH